MKKKTVLRSAVSLCMAFCLTILAVMGYISLETRTASAATLTPIGAANGLSVPEAYTPAGHTLTTDTSKIYTLAGNDWYGVSSADNDWELVDTDAKAGSTNLSSKWGPASNYNGQTILDYTNGLATSFWENLKPAINTVNVDTKDQIVGGQGSISNAYMYPLSYTQFAANTALGGKIYSNAGTHWTRSAGGGSYAWCVDSAAGGLSGSNASNAYRVAPAFHLNLEKVQIMREAQSSEEFGPYVEGSGNKYILITDEMGYAPDFTTSISGASFKGSNLVENYQITYNNAVEGGFIQAAIFDESEKMIYVGSLGTAEGTSGSVILPVEMLSPGKYMLAMWAEDPGSHDGSSLQLASLQIDGNVHTPQIVNYKHQFDRTEALNELPAAELHYYNGEGRTKEPLTIDNINNSLSAETDALTEEPLEMGKTISIPIMDLKTDAPGKGHVRYISAMILDDEENPVYYGKLDYVLEDSDATVNLILPQTLDKAVTYTLLLFEETASTGNDDTASMPVEVQFHVTYRSVADSSDNEVSSEWLSDTQDGIVWYYKLDENLNAINVWTKDAPDNIIDDSGCMNIPATMGKLKYPVTSIGGGTSTTTFVPKSYNGYNAISFPITCTQINQFAFTECQATVNLTIPSQIKTIAPKAFYKAAYLRSVTIKGANLTIGKQAFARCNSLQTFVDTGDNVIISDQAFYKCPKLTQVSLFENVTIKPYAFAECGITSLKMDLMTGTIAERAFENCDILETVYLPNTVTAEGYAFNSCDSLAQIEVDMTNLSSDVFANCPEITKVIFDKNVAEVAADWGGYDQEASEGNINAGGDAVTDNKSEAREFYVCSRNTVFNFIQTESGDYYSAFGFMRSNSDTAANHHFYRVTTIWHTTAEELTSAGANGEQERTAPEASYNEDTKTLTVCAEDIATIINNGIGTLDADNVNYMLSAHKAGKISEPKDAADSTSSRENFLKQNYSQPTAQVAISASYPASVQNDSTINKASFTVYPLYNDGTPYKAVYTPEQFYIVDTDKFNNILMTNENIATNGAIIADEETFAAAVGDDSTITPKELGDDAVSGMQPVTVIVYGEDGQVYTTTVSVMITKKATDYDSLVNEYGSIGAVTVMISNLQSDLADYKLAVISNTNQLWAALGVTGKDSTTDMTSTQLIDNLNNAVAAAKDAGINTSDLQKELDDTKAQLNALTTQYNTVVAQLNELLNSSETPSTSSNDLIHTKEDGSKEIYVDGKWHAVVSGDPTSSEGAVIQKDIEKSDGTIETVDVIVKIDGDTIGTSYTDPDTGEVVSDEYAVQLQNMIRIMTAQLSQLGAQLQTLTDGMKALEEKLGLSGEGTCEERMNAILQAVENVQIKLSNYQTSMDTIYVDLTGEHLSAGEIKDLDASMNKIAPAITALKEENQALVASCSALEAQVEAYKEAIGDSDAQNAIDNLTKQLSDANQTIESQKSQIETLRAEVEGYQTTLNEITDALQLARGANKATILAQINKYVAAQATLVKIQSAFSTDKEGDELVAYLTTMQGAGNNSQGTGNETVNTSSANYKAGYDAGKTAGYTEGYSAGKTAGAATAGSSGTSSTQTTINALAAQTSTLSTKNAELVKQNETLTSENETLNTQVTTLSDGIEDLYDAIPAGSVAGFRSVSSADMSNVTNKLSKVKTYYGNLSQNYQTAINKVDTLQTKNKSLTTKNASLTKKVDALTATNKKLKTENQSLTSANTNLKAQVNAKQNATSQVTGSGSSSSSSGGSAVYSQNTENKDTSKTDAEVSKVQSGSKKEEKKEKEESKTASTASTSLPNSSEQTAQTMQENISDRIDHTAPLYDNKTGGTTEIVASSGSAIDDPTGGQIKNDQVPVDEEVETNGSLQSILVKVLPILGVVLIVMIVLLIILKKKSAKHDDEY